MASSTINTTTAATMASTPAQRANSITSSRKGKKLMVELNFKWSSAASLLRRHKSGDVYLEGSVVRELAAYSSTAEDVSIGVYFPSASSLEPVLKNKKIPALFNRIVATLNSFTSIRSVWVAFTLDAANFDSEWPLFKHAACFYALDFKAWTLWVKVLGQTKEEEVDGKVVQAPLPFTQIHEGSKVECRLTGHFKALQEVQLKGEAATAEAAEANAETAKVEAEKRKEERKTFFREKARKEKEERKEEEARAKKAAEDAKPSFTVIGHRM